jgi:O-antigen/teichoic acid export membrane protein
MWWPIHAINLNLLQVKGRSDLFLKLEIIKKTIGVMVLILSIPLGLLFMCYVGIVTSILCLIINTYYTGKLIQVGFLMQMKDLSGTLLLSLSMFVVVFLSTMITDNYFIQLATGIIIGLLYFFAVCFIVRLKEMEFLKSVIKR